MQLYSVLFSVILFYIALLYFVLFHFITFYLIFFCYSIIRYSILYSMIEFYSQTLTLEYNWCISVVDTRSSVRLSYLSPGSSVPQVGGCTGTPVTGLHISRFLSHTFHSAVSFSPASTGQTHHLSPQDTRPARRRTLRERNNKPDLKHLIKYLYMNISFTKWPFGKSSASMNLTGQYSQCLSNPWSTN